MKKKRLRLVTTIALLAALAGGSGGVAWGQAYKKGIATEKERSGLRRKDLSTPIAPVNPLYPNADTIGIWYHSTEQLYGVPSGYKNVNNEFGAGESVWIQNGITIFIDSVAAAPLIPQQSNNLTIPALKIGSTESQNIVINTYNAGGYASGWLEVKAFRTICGNAEFYSSPVYANIGPGILKVPKRTDTDGDGRDYSRITQGINEYRTFTTNTNGVRLSNGYFNTGASLTSTMVTGSISSQGGNMGALDGVLGYGTMEDETQVELYMAQHGATAVKGGSGYYRYNKAMYKTPYTTTGVYTGHTPTPNDFPSLQDDGIWLFQYAGNKLISVLTANAGSVGTAPQPTGGNAYRRPTTVAVKGSTNSTVSNFSEITFNTLHWYYQQHEIRQFGPPINAFYNTVDKSANHPWDCCHYKGNPPYSTPSDYGSGLYASQPSIEIKVTSIPDWTDLQPQQGSTQLDAAVQLLAGARVCVENNVEDKTGNIATPAAAGTYTLTNAVVVLPDTVRFTLRTKGNFKANMVHSKAKVDTHNALYLADEFPIAANDDIWLWGSNTSDKQTFGSALHEFQPVTVPFHNKGDRTPTTTVKPYLETTNALFGVYGDYQYAGLMAEVHTDTSSAYNTSGKGIIEVGPTTDGKKHFHIYGQGMLKNYEGCSGPSDNFAMEFGEKKGITNHGGTPSLKINTQDTLYIINFGNNGTGVPCAADLQFYTTSVDSIHEAFKGTGYGALQIQALNSVRFRTDGTGATGPSGGNGWDATSNGNDIYVLSDAGNISTQKLNIKSDNVSGKGHGYINFLAAGLNIPSIGCSSGNRNSGLGSIYFNDEVKIERTAATSTQTNIIAQNNIRTAKFTSTNPNVDTTNILSRMGDIWLGYSVGTATVDPSSDNSTTNGKSADDNVFTYNGTGTTGQLNIMAGWDDSHTTMTTSQGMEGGNVYFTHLTANMAAANKHNATIAIPYSSEYICGATADELLYNRKNSYQAYEHSGIIGGVGACGVDPAWSSYAGLLEDGTNPATAHDTSLVYHGNEGNLILDAGRRGNIIMNRGAQIEFQDKTGNATFRTRHGDIDMRDPVDVEKMKGSLLFLAQIADITKLSNIGVCGCDEERNNVYLQDFKYTATGNSGSVFIGADNNIKLNYGGLANIGTRQDPFLSKAYKEDPLTHRPLKVGRGYTAGGGCGNSFHCDLDGSENKARDLELNFSGSVTSGGFAAVASDMIDVYKNLIYHGGTGSGLSTVPETGTLHGEDVAGYGLFMKTQGNKHNWTDNILLQAPKCPTTCSPTGCSESGRPATGFLHNTVRMTFHSDARFFAENQHVHLESPVIETFGALELNAEDGAGAKAMITIKTDSLICHDSLIRKGTGKVQLTTWSGLPKDQPIIKLGYSRKAAPFAEYSVDEDLSGAPKLCRECVSHYKGKVYPPGETPLDTMFVKFGPDTEWERQNVMVVDHTVISFLTDSFDHVRGGDVRHARYFVDTTKIRNQVEFWTDAKHERDGHLELISEEQMGSKDYAGLYTRHLHLEPIGACGRPTSELWLPGLALDVITTSTFGGFGIQYTDVHVENGANLNPGFTSLRLRGQCYEQACGTLTMKDLRLDGGSELHFSVGTTKGLNGEYSDAIDVDRLTTYGPVNVNIEIRPCEKMQKRCYPIMYYKSVTPNSLNNLKLNPRKVKIDGEEYPLSLNVSTDGIVYVCVGDAVTPGLTHTVTMPETAGVKTTPSKGIYPLPTRTSFRFSATYSGAKPLVVRTNRKVNGQQEVLNGVKNANGEYEYIVPSVQQEVTLTFGPDVVANELLTAGTAVWSHGEKIYIRVERADIASIYSVAGQLVKRVDLPEGDTSIPMSRGAYVITLKDGSVHKVIVK